MSRQLQVLSKLEMRAVIRFLWVKRCNCCEIDRQLHEIYDENAMSSQVIAKWCDIIENRSSDIDDAERERRPFTATNSEMAACVSESIHANRHIIKIDISNELDIFHGGMLKVIVHELKFQKVCVR